jgi:biotin carboxyl carrier protein
VHAGQVLLTLESMKMESGVSSPRDGEIAKIHVDSGQAVEAGDLLVEFVD